MLDAFWNGLRSWLVEEILPSNVMPNNEVVTSVVNVIKFRAGIYT